MKTRPATREIPSGAAKIAKEILDQETLETRKSDRLDFHELAISEIFDALEAAYDAGRRRA